MKKLIRIELIKILNYRPFQILMGLYIITIVLGLVIYPLIDKQIPFISLSDLFRFPDVWLFMTWIAEVYSIVLALVVIMLITTEFSNHTYKTQVMFGMARSSLITQKLVMITIITLIASLVLGLTTVMLGLTHSYKITLGIALENISSIILYFLSAYTLMLFGMFLALFIKNTALALLGFLGYRTFLEPLIFVILLNKEKDICWYLPMRANTRLTPLPDLIAMFQRKMESGGNADVSTENFLPEGLPLWANIALVLAYIGLITFFSYRIMSKKRLT